MKVEIYTLDRGDLELFGDSLPEYVVSYAKIAGYFTIGAVKRSKSDGEDRIVGMAQFYINITPDGECFADIDYVFVSEEERRKGIATRLMDRINTILKKSDVKTSYVKLPGESDALLGIYEKKKSLEGFLKECGFVSANDDTKIYRANLSDLQKASSGKRVSDEIKPIGALSDTEFTSLMERIVENTDRKDPVANDIRLEASEYSADLSVYYSKPGSEGVLLVRRLGEEAMEIVIHRGYGKCDDAILFEMAVAFVEAAGRQYEQAFVIVKDMAHRRTANVKSLIPGISELDVKRYVRVTLR